MARTWRGGFRMQRYKDRSGRSGVVAFTDGERYLYDHAAPGPVHVERMKALALAGRGLATYINQHVRGGFARKL